MSALKSVSAVMLALAVYFSDDGQVPLSGCRFKDRIAFSADLIRSSGGDLVRL